MDDQLPSEESQSNALKPENAEQSEAAPASSGVPGGMPPRPPTPPPLQPPLPPPPPPFLTPPPIAVLPPPRRGGSGWRIVAIIALIVLAFSLMGNLSQVGRVLGSASSVERSRHFEEVYIDHKSSTSDKILVVDVQGVIGGGSSDGGGAGMVDSISEQLKAAAKDHDIKAVLLKVDSPGGEVLAADDINRAITKYQDATGNPVVASMGSLAASGGYYVSAPCRWIVANELTITGSIGVIMHGYNYRGLMDKVGVQPKTFKSGKFKDMLSSDSEPDINKLPPEERETRLQEDKMVQDLITETFERFKSVVKTGRMDSNRKNASQGQRLASNWESYADGRVLSGKQAYDLGFVDELGTFDDAAKRARQIANIHSASLIAYREPFNLGSLLGMFGKSDAKSIKVDLGLGATRLQAGHMYYITPMVLN